MSTAPSTLTVQQRLLCDHFLRTRGIPLSQERIAAVLYGATWDGGPEFAAAAVRMHIRRLRQRLEPFGVKVLTIGAGRGSEGWLVDPDHFEKLHGILEEAPALAVALARARAVTVR